MQFLGILPPVIKLLAQLFVGDVLPLGSEERFHCAIIGRAPVFFYRLEWKLCEFRQRLGPRRHGCWSFPELRKRRARECALLTRGEQAHNCRGKGCVGNRRF